MLMQQLLPIALRRTLPKIERSVLIDLCGVFKELCSKVFDTTEFERIESQTIMTLCELEKLFPPSFFDVMVHLVIHLVEEARIAGPVHYRWMYPIESEYHSILRVQMPYAQKMEIDHIHQQTFHTWFTNQVEKLSLANNGLVNEELQRLARGPKDMAKRLKEFVINGVKFYTKSYELNRRTQTSGVMVNAKTLSYASSKDKNPIEGVVTYYGKKEDEHAFTLVNFSRLFHTGERLSDDPLVLASQAEQVFYVQDPVDTRWHVVNKAILRGFYDMLGHEFADDVALWERLDNDSTIRPWCIVSLSIKVTPSPLNLNMKLSEIARANHSQLKMSHTSGRKSYARIRADETMKSGGLVPSRAEIFRITHTKKNHQPVDLKSAEVMSESSHCVASRFDSLSNLGRRSSWICAYIWTWSQPTRMEYKRIAEQSIRNSDERVHAMEERMLGMQKTIEEMAMQMRSMRMAMENMPSGRSDATQHVDCTYAFPPNFHRQQTHPPELTKSSQPECSKLTRTSQSLEPSSTSSFLHDQVLSLISLKLMSFYFSKAARVDLLSFKTPEEVVAQGRVICKNPNQEVGGFKLGPDFWEVYIEVAVKEQEFLIRPRGHFSTIKEVVGSTIAWPSTKGPDPFLGTHRPCYHTALDKTHDDHIRDTIISHKSKIQSSCARDCRDSSSLKTTPVLSDPGTRVIPIKPPRLPYDDPRESVQSY
ncbi:UNVERIFIED_CONTAM: hypothetical protein Slati_1709300 [Sesamum latifolium]|uniref:Transposase n=1 Tax=Sesamum latifolium TaxID=2727402 RepID=A0AAW2WXZ9_9LAMI